VAAVGEVIVNPATGERVEFLRTRETTGGRLLELELTLAPHARVGGLPHQHPATEIVEVIEGALVCRIRRQRRELRAGDSLTVPAGVGHYLYNETDEIIRARVTALPACDFETFFETVFALAHRRQYKAFRGLPAPLHAALLARTYDVYAPVVPITLQRAVLDRLMPLARKRGYPVKVPPIVASKVPARILTDPRTAASWAMSGTKNR
jgi:quercetin dioxygenase-like cupin family protein